MDDITVIIPTVREREGMLGEAIGSVLTQTLRCSKLMVETDDHRVGPAVLRQRMLEAASTEWIAFLDDDDLLDPHHLQLLMEVARRDHVDVAASYCRFLPGHELPPKYCNRPYDRAALREHGIMPITVLARRQTLIDAGGFDAGDRYEDWSMWNRVADNGGTFTIDPVVTWTYRLGHGNRTFS